MLRSDYLVPVSGNIEEYYYLNAKNYLNEYDIDYLISEAMTKEQKEAGQREINKKHLNPFFQLEKYLNDKWIKEKDIRKKAIEKKRFNEILQKLKSPEVDKDTYNYVKNVLGTVPNITLGKDSENHFIELAKGVPAIGLSTKEQEYVNGIRFNINDKKIRKNVRQFIILHEYGHLFEYLKRFVEDGKFEVIDTFDRDIEKVTKSESDANTYALNNMYRKDRREMLKNSDLSKKKIDYAKEELNSGKGYHKSSQYLAGIPSEKFFNY